MVDGGLWIVDGGLWIVEVSPPPITTRTGKMEKMTYEQKSKSRILGGNFGRLFPVSRLLFSVSRYQKKVLDYQYTEK